MRLDIKASAARQFVVLVLFSLLAGPVTARQATTVSEDEVSEFVVRWLDLSQKNENFDKVMGLYASKVDFYKRGRINKQAVATDKRKYFDRWPHREHRLISLTIRPDSTEKETRASFSFHYKIRNAKGVVKEGDANASLLLRRAKNAFVIVSEKEATVPAGQTVGAVTSDPDKEAATRAGKMVIRKGADRADALYLNGKKIHEGWSLEIIKVLNGEKSDFVLVASYSGGIACPAEAIIIELSSPANYRLSEEFGSCSDIMEAKLDGDSVIVEMPAYTGHPEFLDEEGRKSLRTVKEIFAWKHGKVMKSTAGGLDFKRCFPQTGAGGDQVLRELQAETRKRGGKDIQKGKPKQLDANDDGHPDWFIATDDCSAAVGCFGDIYLYYEKSEVCPGRGYCYAGSNYNVLLAPPDMRLQCEASYRDLGE